MGDWPRDERCGCPILSHDLECTQKSIRENPRKWGEGLRGQIEILTQERDRYKAALKKIGGCCSCPGTDEYPYGRAQAPEDSHTDGSCDMKIKYDALATADEAYARVVTL